MTTITPNVADQYIHKVMRLIHAPADERQRIQADLQSHLQEGLAEGEDMTALVERMGDPARWRLSSWRSSLAHTPVSGAGRRPS